MPIIAIGGGAGTGGGGTGGGGGRTLLESVSHDSSMLGDGVATLLKVVGNHKIWQTTTSQALNTKFNGDSVVFLSFSSYETDDEKNIDHLPKKTDWMTDKYGTIAIISAIYKVVRAGEAVLECVCKTFLHISGRGSFDKIGVEIMRNEGFDEYFGKKENLNLYWARRIQEEPFANILLDIFNEIKKARTYIAELTK